MPLWIVVFILGLIEGLTEFVPVSSTGHLLIAEHWLPRQSDLFNIVIQGGAVLAVLPLFWPRLVMLTHLHERASRLLLAKIGVAFGITGAVGYVLEKKGFKLPEQITPVALALIIGGVIFIAVELLLKGQPAKDEITWPVVLLVALGQLIAAVFPGASRSGMTIILALILGASRPAATEFSFLVGVPTMLAATALKLFKGLHHSVPSTVPENWAMLGLATIVAALVSFITVKWLLRYVQTHSFVSFGVYRIALGILLLIFFSH